MTSVLTNEPISMNKLNRSVYCKTNVLKIRYHVKSVFGCNNVNRYKCIKKCTDFEIIFII